VGAYSLSTVTEATLNAVELCDAKSHLNVDHNDDDVEITRIVKAATAWVEARIGRHLARTVLMVKYWGFPATICLVDGPVKEVISITYLDVDQVEQTLAADQYNLDAYNRIIYRAYGVSWPSTLYDWNAVRVTYAVGYYDETSSPVFGNESIPEDLRAGVLLAVGDMYENRERQQDMQLYKNDFVDDLIVPYRIMEL